MSAKFYRYLQRRPRLKAVIALLRGRSVIPLDYPLQPRARYGFGQPPHAALLALIEARRDSYSSVLRRWLALRQELAALPPTWWRNDYLPALDAAALYAFTVERCPAQYFEIGSGTSTRFVRAAIDQYQLPCRLTSIDPAPRRDIDSLCHTVIRQPLEDVDLSLFQHLCPGDILFVDNSHHSFQNSDATVFFLDILPTLPAGVLVGIHDIMLPDDYPPSYRYNFYSEQYLLAAYILGGARRVEIVLPAWYVSQLPELRSLADQLLPNNLHPAVDKHGCAFWMRTLPLDSLSGSS